ncbi:PilW family protein [Collimonas sp. NPDC087041]|uniref:PilW family protein n=1 Tax=Collimonas sp. NPDC087041 TaxID=3363960 RepID=UPI0037FCE80A
MVANTYYSLQRARGFSLPEIMVALVIGLISMLVVLQTFSASEGLKRSTTGGDDAQVAGAIGLFEMERDISQAGYGINATGLIGCNVKLPTGKTVALAPVTINPATTLLPAGDANTDTLLVAYGNPAGSTEGNLITNQVTSPTVYTLQSTIGYNKNDYVVAAQIPPASPANPATCSGLALDTVAGTPTTNVTVKTGVANVNPNTYILYDLGPAPTIVGYAVRNGNLTTCNYNDTTKDCTSATTSGNWIDIAGNISSLRALYGHDNSTPGAMTGIASLWDQTTPSTTCGWVRTSAVSVALVARNNEFSKTAVTTASPKWSEPVWGAGTPIAINLSGNAGLPAGATWQNYRYQMYSTVVPLHNVAWMGQVSGC